MQQTCSSVQTKKKTRKINILRVVLKNLREINTRGLSTLRRNLIGFAVEFIERAEIGFC